MRFGESPGSSTNLLGRAAFRQGEKLCRSRIPEGQSRVIIVPWHADMADAFVPAALIGVSREFAVEVPKVGNG
jgi:hypothetical protein